MYAFTYNRASGLRQATNLLGSLDDPKLLAGGQTLLPTMKQRLASPANIVDLNMIEGIADIELKGRSVVIGAMARHAEVANSPIVQQNIPALAYLAGLIGDPAVRHRGTIGGSTANADPAADYPAGIVGLGATIETNKRKSAADDFFTGLFETALEPGELIIAVHFPIPDKAGYLKFAHLASGYATCGVMVSKTGNQVRVGVTGAGPNAFRVPEMEAALAKTFTPDAIANIKYPADELLSDMHASAEYRAHLVTVIAKRAVAAALA